ALESATNGRQRPRAILSPHNTRQNNLATRLTHYPAKTNDFCRQKRVSRHKAPSRHNDAPPTQTQPKTSSNQHPSNNRPMAKKATATAAVTGFDVLIDPKSIQPAAVTVIVGDDGFLQH